MHRACGNAWRNSVIFPFDPHMIIINNRMAVITLQYSTENKFRARIEKLNREGYTSTKLAALLLAFWLCSFAVGLFGLDIFGIPFDDKTDAALLGHFSSSLKDAESLDLAFRAVLRYSFTEILAYALVFISGFTLFSSFICSLVNVYRGLCFGLAVSYLSLSVARSKIIIEHFVPSVSVFVIFNVLISAAIIIFSVRAIVFSYEYRRHTRRRIALVRYARDAMISFGSVIILNFIRFALSGIYNI